jgi:hypothetical protein
MKVRFYIKDPDGFHDGAVQAAEKLARDIGGGNSELLDDNERADIIERRRNRILDKLEPWTDFGECVVLELDFDTGDMVILPKNKW